MGRNEEGEKASHKVEKKGEIKNWIPKGSVNLLKYISCVSIVLIRRAGW